MINVENNSTPDLNHDPAVDFTECVSLCPIQNMPGVHWQVIFRKDKVLLRWRHYGNSMD